MVYAVRRVGSWLSIRMHDNVERGAAIHARSLLFGYALEDLAHACLDGQQIHGSNFLIQSHEHQAKTVSANNTAIMQAQVL